MKRALLIVSTVLAGCTAGFNYTKTSGEVTKAKPANCNFRVVSVVPTEVRVVEIGVLEFDRGGFGITDMSEFREAIAAQVCEAGGDIVVAQVNGAGMYM